MAKDCCDNCKEGKECCSVHEGKFSSVATKQLVKKYKQMADERLSGSAALTFRLIAKELIKRKAKLESVNEKMDKEQFHDYMQYVLKTQFKTPEEKKMKKSIIKKLNIANKKKGLRLFKESINESTKRQFRNVYSKYYKTYEAFAREVMKLAKSVTKISGDRTDERVILKNFKKQVIPFAGLMNSWSKGRESNPHIDESVNEGRKSAMVFKKLYNSRREFIIQMRKMRDLLGNTDPKFFPNIEGEIYKYELDFIKKSMTIMQALQHLSKSPKMESVNEKMDKEQFHDYMQYVLKTQFKTPEEKKMKKSIIKKLNIANKKKGLRLFKERTQSIGGEDLMKYLMKRFKMSKSKAIATMKKHKMDMSFLKNESVNEYDLGLTYKKGKTVKVKHKSSGKRLVIVDKPNVRREYQKIGYFAESGKYY